jgi:hypothetical protein
MCVHICRKEYLQTFSDKKNVLREYTMGLGKADPLSQGP